MGKEKTVKIGGVKYPHNSRIEDYVKQKAKENKYSKKEQKTLREALYVEQAARTLAAAKREYENLNKFIAQEEQRGAVLHKQLNVLENRARAEGAAKCQAGAQQEGYSNGIKAVSRFRRVA